MNSIDVIAERSLLFVAPDGTEIISKIQFGRPYTNEAHGWCCDFEIPDVQSRTYGAGIDGIQAILLTMSLAETLLEMKLSDGWKIRWPDTFHEIAPREIFEADHFFKLRAGT
jgi:hypothetical protein